MEKYGEVLARVIVTCLVGAIPYTGKDQAQGPGKSAGVGALPHKLAEQLDDLGLVPVDLLGHAFQPLVQADNLLAEVPDFLIKVADLEADRGQVALDDAELAVVLLRGVFVAASQRGKLAVGDGVFRHGLGSRM